LQALVDNYQSQTEVISDFNYGGTRGAREEIEVVHRLTHPNLRELRELPMVLPRVVKHRTGISTYSLTKLPGKVTGLLDNFTMLIRDQTDGRDYRVTLRPKSFVIHLGGSASGGHYVQISRLASGQFLYKSDATVREISPQDAEELLQTGAQMVVSEVVDRAPV
jgi:hypothetical protein